MLNKLYSAVSYSAVGRELKSNKPVIYAKLCIFQQKHVKQGYVLIG